MKKTSDKFLKLLHSFLTVYLPKQRNSSLHTVLAARQVWSMFLGYVCDINDKKAERLVFADFNHSVVVGFLDTREKEKGWMPETRNHRLGVIRSFFRYTASIEPTLGFHSVELMRIPLKRSPNKSQELQYMSQEAMAALLREPGTTTKMGVRDTFFLSLMYDTAARNGELLGLRFCDLDSIRKTVYLLGKGSKPRIVPITDGNTIALFRKYAKLYHNHEDGVRPMFYTVRHGEIGHMSDDNIARLIKKYGAAAKKHCTEVPDHPHPHMIRRTRAMHMYQGGMPLEAIALFLGHEDPITTRIYAKADTEMKRKAMEKVKEKGFISESPKVDDTAIWNGNEEMIKILCGL